MTRPRSPAFALMLLGSMWLFPAHAVAEDVSGIGGFILSEQAEAETITAHLNFALTKLGQAAFSDASRGEVWRELELRFDAGNLRKRDLSRAKKHLDQMFRRIEKKDLQEASEQLFRARRFIMKTFPFSMDSELFAEILYYQTVVDEKLGNSKKARADYCTYLYAMSNLSRSATSIGQRVQELKSCEPKDETGELVLTSTVEGGVVFIDGAPVGVVGSKIPYTAPFLGIGYHFVEVRKPGMARWGEVVEIKASKSIKRRVRLKRARAGVREVELDPLSSLVLFGDELSDESYIQDIMFQYSQRVGLSTLLVGRVKSLSGGGAVLKLVRFSAGKLRVAEVDIKPQEFEFERVMMRALRGVGIESSLTADLGPKSNPDYLFFKVK